MVLCRCDLAQCSDSTECFVWMRGTRVLTVASPLAAVHTAGLLRDALLMNQTWSKIQDVFGPKAKGGWSLHRQLFDLSFNVFLCYSSEAALLGNVG